MEKKRVADVITECLKSKEEDKLSDRYLKQLDYDLARFGAKFKNFIGDVAGADLDQWLRDLGVSGRTRNNIRMSVQTLFGFAKAAMIFSNYRELLTPQDAKAWFAIVPAARGKRAKGKAKAAA